MYDKYEACSPLAVQSFPLGDLLEVDPTGGEDLVVRRVGDVGLHVEVHATVAGVEVRRVARVVDRLTDVTGARVVHLDGVDVMVDVAGATGAEGAGDSAVG